MDHGKVSVLVLSRDERFRSGLVRSLNFLGYVPMAAANWDEADASTREYPVDCILLEDDWPDDGDFSVLSKVLAVDRPSVLMMADTVEEWREIAALAHGADDYVAKSIGLGSLAARIMRSTRRTGRWAPEVSRLPRLMISKEAHTVKMGERMLRLTHKEMNLLDVFIRASDAVLSRETLLDRVWGLDSLEFEVRTVDVAIARLRKKLSLHLGINPIETVPGSGYRFRLDQARVEWAPVEGAHDL